MKRLSLLALFFFASTVAAQLPSATITGTVTDGSGTPLEGILVEGFSFPEHPIGPHAVTAADGTYSLSVDLAAASFFKLRFSDPQGVVPTEWWQDAADYDDARYIVVVDGDLTGVDAMLDGSTVAPLGGAIEGTVSDGSGPLAGIQVRCERADVPSLRNLTTTANDGSYRCGSVLPTGDYLVRFSDPDDVYATEYYDDEVVPAAATLVSVTFGATTPAIDAELAPGGVITGYVIDEFGQDYSNGRAYLFAFADGQWLLADIETAAFQDGFYVFEGVRPGTYRLAHAYKEINHPFDTTGEVYANGASFEDFADATDLTQADLIAGTPVDVVAGLATQFVNGILADTGNTVTGTVTDTNGNPLEGVQVRLWQSLSSYDRPVNGRIVYTAADGSYAVEDWPGSGEYHLQFTLLFGGLTEFYDDVDNVGLATPLSATGTLGGIDVVLDGGSNNPAANVITGTVTDTNGAPIEEVFVTCWTVFGPAANCSDITAADGTYELPGQPAGMYYVYFSKNGLAPEWYDDTFQTTANPVTVTDVGPTTGIDAVLEPSGRIQGTVTAPGNVPLEGEVTLYAEIGGVWVPVAVIPTHGAYSVYTKPDTYRVRFEAGFDPFTQLVEYYDNQPTLPLADDVVIPAGGTVSGIDAVLFDSPLVFTGDFETGDAGGWSVMIEDD